MFSEEQVRKMLEEMFNEGRCYESASYQPQTRADAIKYYSDKIISAQSVQRTGFQPPHGHVFIGGKCECGEQVPLPPFARR